MANHPFQAGRAYSVDKIVRFLRKTLNSGRIANVREKNGYIELIEYSSYKKAKFIPFSSGWGASPLNPNTWKTMRGKPLLPNFKRKKRRKHFTKQQREAIWRRTQGHCYSCGMKLDNKSEWWIEHIIPFSLGGSDEIENLLPSCRICNWVRSNYGPGYITRMLTVGSVLIREVDRRTDLGKSVRAFLVAREKHLSRLRKNKDLALSVIQ